ncbi:hypothetical protein HRI_005071900 [Hibiscus trionum]|uniref:NAC domain-containing protein n=1 Tax=Hibiscus trionum TaxID=183268 RepID=A0A9W7JJ16_HIBTR|nr:hypothetical protein HRI_005071900 [Hibiscus trionum]
MAYSVAELLLNREEDELGVPNCEQYKFLGSPMDRAEIYEEAEFKIPASWEMVGNCGEDDSFRAPETDPVENYGENDSFKATEPVENCIDEGERIPVGFRFEPTDEELAAQYLISKVSGDPLPASDFREVDATEFYGQHPKCLVDFCNGEREWHFFIHTKENVQNGAIRSVGNNLGFWRLDEEDPISDAKGNVLAMKSHFIYFFKGAKKSHWKLDEIRLPLEFYHLHNCKEKWAMAKLTRGRVLG